MGLPSTASMTSSDMRRRRVRPPSSREPWGKRLLRMVAMVVATHVSLAHARDKPLDEVTLKDGRRVRGRLVREESRWLVVETEDGHLRSFNWDTVEEVDRFGERPQTTSPEVAQNAWRTRGGGTMSYELRANLMGLVLPKETFGLTGFCATGVGSTEASVFGQSASDATRGVGGGVGGRVSYMHIPLLEPGVSSSWWSFRFGAGLDLDLLHARVPQGIPPLHGELCSQVVRTDHDVSVRSEALPVAHVPVQLGVLLALGSFRDATVWRGIVVGAAWSPSYLQVGLPWNNAASGYFHHLGLELTVDIATLNAVRPGRRTEPHLRVAFFIAPAITSGLPVIGSIGVGPVWY